MAELQEIKAELDALEEELQAVYRKLWPVREAYAQAAPPAALPSRRNRTDKQERIARCPRCGSRESESRAERAANVLAINFHSKSGLTLGGRDPIEILHDLAGILYEESEGATQNE